MPKYPALSELARDVITQANSQKAAEERDMQKVAAYGAVKTDVGRALTKLASALRENAETPVTFGDLVEYRRRNGF